MGWGGGGGGLVEGGWRVEGWGQGGGVGAGWMGGGRGVCTEKGVIGCGWRGGLGRGAECCKGRYGQLPPAPARNQPT